MNKRHKLHAGVAVLATAVLSGTVWAASGAPGETTARTEQARSESGRVTEPLRREHKELVPHIAALADAGDAVGAAPLAEQEERVHASYTFLDTQLIPHAVAEDEVLYAEVDSLLGTTTGTRATDTMRRDHVEVGALTERLGELGGELEDGPLPVKRQQELRGVLYALNGIVALHFAKEEEVYLPLLDRNLTHEQAQAMFAEMEAATARAGGAAHDH